MDSLGNCDNVVDGVTAVKVLADKLPSKSSVTIEYTMADIATIQAGDPASIVNDISLTSYDALPSPVLHAQPVTTRYLGNTLVLSLDKFVLQTSVGQNSEAIDSAELTNQLSIVAETARGFDLTLQTRGEQNALLNTDVNMGNTTPLQTLIPAKAGRPTKGSPSWAVRSNRGLDWSAVPTNNENPLTLYSSSTSGPDSAAVAAIYGVATGANHLSGNYSAEVVYTLTAKL